MNITPDAWSADTEALRARIARLEAQSEVRRLQVAYWQERAQVFWSARQTAIRTQIELRQEAADERGAALDLIEQVKIRDAKIQAVEDVARAWEAAPGRPEVVTISLAAAARIRRALGSVTSPGQ